MADPPQTSPRASTDEEILQQQYLRALPTVRLRGLVPEAVYRIDRIDSGRLADTAQTLSGAG